MGQTSSACMCSATTTNSYDCLRPTLDEIVKAYLQLYGPEALDSDADASSSDEDADEAEEAAGEEAEEREEEGSA